MLTKYHIFVFIFSINTGINVNAQNFVNPDLDGNSTSTNNTPYFWQNVPYTDINCLANLALYATTDVTAFSEPNATIGIVGNPYSGDSFVSGIRAESGSNVFHEGIQQYVSGFTINESYTINFQQTVVKQINCLDSSGSWSIYVDNDLIGTTAPSISDTPYNSTSLNWDFRSITFTATSNAHTIKFLPEDDDLYLSSIDSIGALRMGIDSIYITPCPLTNLGSDTTLCDGDTLHVDEFIVDATYLWQDNSTGPNFNITEAGSYWVEIIKGGCISSDTILVSYNSLPEIDLGNDTTLCDGDFLDIDVASQNYSYLWQDNSTSANFTITETGTYWVDVVENNCTQRDSITVNYTPLPEFNLGNDTIICGDNSLLLTSSIINGDYLWQDGTIDNSYLADIAGVYWLEVTKNGCSYTDSIQLAKNELPLINLGIDTNLCQGQEIIFDLTGTTGNLLWQDGSTNQLYTIKESGEYWVELEFNNCINSDTIRVGDKDCDIALDIPNIFTPNNDGINDVFTPTSAHGVETMTTLIFNRWGDLIFETNELEINWMGINSVDGTYFWFITYTDIYNVEYNSNGHVTITR